MRESAAFAERLFAQFLIEPEKVPPSWQRYFDELLRSGRPVIQWKCGPQAPAIGRRPACDRPRSRRARAGRVASDATARQLHLDGALLQDRVDHLIRAVSRPRTSGRPA